MNSYQIFYLLILVFPVYLLCIEVTQEDLQLTKRVQSLPHNIRLEIFKRKCVQLCPQLIEQAQTLPELKKLFKSFIALDRYFRPSVLFQSTLFKLLEMKKYKILYDIEKQLKNSKDNDYINKEFYSDISFNVLSRGINAQTDNRGDTPFYCSAWVGDESSAELLIKNGANVDAQDVSLWTPLHRATRRGKANIAKMLIEHGADVNAQDKDQFTPLHEAAFWGYEIIAKILIKNGANMHMTNIKNQTALDVARHEGYKAIVELLNKKLEERQSGKIQ